MMRTPKLDGRYNSGERNRGCGILIQGGNIDGRKICVLKQIGME